MLEERAEASTLLERGEVDPPSGIWHIAVVGDDAVVVEGVGRGRLVVPVEAEHPCQVRVQRECLQQVRPGPVQRRGGVLVAVREPVEALRVGSDEVVENGVQIVAKAGEVGAALVCGQPGGQAGSSLGLVVRCVRMGGAPDGVCDR